MKKHLIWLLIGLVLVSQCFALGVAPGHTDINFEPGAVVNVDFKVINIYLLYRLRQFVI